jgi:hypothetical protein
MAERGIDLVSPHRCNRSKPRAQDGRALRRNRPRWRFEHTFAWLGNYRRAVVRCNRSAAIREAFSHTAGFLIAYAGFWKEFQERQGAREGKKRGRDADGASLGFTAECDQARSC